ncbi:MAG TPA: hypothetical protein DCE11_06715 [Ruminiclostridium sp.]|nr:hypothetical protein [Ruminiclostridium sp.]
MCFVAQGNETPEAGPAGIMSNASGRLAGRDIAAAFRLVRGPDSGVFGDDGRHAPEPCCL